MKLIDLSVNDFVNEVDSNSPAPGGGSVAALAGSLGSSLSRMVGHLTVGKKKFKALDEDTKLEFNNALIKLEVIKDNLVELIDKDTEAFNLIMSAFKLPKGTDEEKLARKESIEVATIVAIDVPLNVAILCREGMGLLDTIKANGNKNCLSDLGVSMLLMHTGLIGAIMNVKINIPGLSNQTQIAGYSNQIANLLMEADTMMSKFTKNILNSL
jgi:formiminotetrahydrofolate cyclodeaminase